MGEDHQMKFISTLLFAVSMIATAGAQEQALSAGAFIDSVGVNTHLAYTNSTYNNFPMVLQALTNLGVKHIRDGYYNWPSGNNYYTQFQELNAAGITADFVVPYQPSVTAANLTAFCALATNCEAFEYPNELDSSSQTTVLGTTTVATAVQQMSTPLLAATATLKIPLIGPSFTQAATFTSVGNIAPLMTTNNLHIYFGGRNPESKGWGSTDVSGNGYGSIGWWLDNAAVDAPGKPSWVTETGYNILGCTLKPATSTAPYAPSAGQCAQYPDPSYTAYTIPANQSGSYVLRTLLEMYASGIKRTYLYELFDDPSSPNFGLIYANGDTKRGYNDLQSFMFLMNDGVNPNEASETGKLTYTLGGSTTNVSHVLLEKRDGTFWLALWVSAPNVDVSGTTPTGNPIAVPIQEVTLSLPANTLQVQYKYNHNQPYGLTAVAAHAVPNNYTIPVDDNITLLRIR
jgi:hypothetical protein